LLSWYFHDVCLTLYFPILCYVVLYYSIIIFCISNVSDKREPLVLLWFVGSFGKFRSPPSKYFIHSLHPLLLFIRLGSSLACIFLPQMGARGILPSMSTFFSPTSCLFVHERKYREEMIQIRHLIDIKDKGFERESVTLQIKYFVIQY
jgi:hypothetical protein